jgi:hypothetical protein
MKTPDKFGACSCDSALVFGTFPLPLFFDLHSLLDAFAKVVDKFSFLDSAPNSVTS